MTCNAVCSAGCGGACTDGCGIACQNTCGISCAGNCLQSCSDYCSATCTGNCSNSCSTSCNSLAGAGVTGAGLNLVRNGTLSSFGQGLVNWDSVWTLSALNDGNGIRIKGVVDDFQVTRRDGTTFTVATTAPVSVCSITYRPSGTIRLSISAIRAASHPANPATSPSVPPTACHAGPTSWPTPKAAAKALVAKF